MTRDRDALLDRIKDQLPTQPDAFERLAELRETKARRRRATAGAVGIGLAVALIWGLFALAPFSNDVPVERLGSVDSPVPLVAQPGQYYYVRLEFENNGKVEIWLGPDGSGRRVVHGSGSAVDELIPPKDGEKMLTTELSTDPDEVLQQLIVRSGPDGSSPMAIASTSPGRSQVTTSVLRSIGDLLTYGSSFLTPEQIKALFEAAQQIEGVTTETDVVDPWGRPAVRLTHVIDYPPGPASDLEWYFDPATGQFLGEQWVNQETGEAGGRAVIEMAGIVGSVDDIPVPQERYVPMPRLAAAPGAGSLEPQATPEAS
jgi:hypothetical protein